jgi:hypothetical protein
MLRHPQCQGTPAAAEFEDILPIGKFGPRQVRAEHRFLGLIEALVTPRKQAARVLQAAAETQFEEPRRQLVVLLVRRIGMDRDRAGAEVVEALPETRPSRNRIAAMFFAQPLRAQAADAEADQGVGKPAAFGEADW